MAVSPFPGNANSLSAQILDRVDIAFRPGLHAQASAMDSAGELYVQSLFDRFKEIHDEVMSDIETAESEHILVVGPFTLHQADIEPLLFEKSFLDRAKDRRFASQTDVADPDLI